MHTSRGDPKKGNRNPFPHSLAALALFPWQQKREMKDDLLALKSPNALINILQEVYTHRHDELGENQSTNVVLCECLPSSRNTSKSRFIRFTLLIFTIIHHFIMPTYCFALALVYNSTVPLLYIVYSCTAVTLWPYFLCRLTCNLDIKNLQNRARWVIVQDCVILWLFARLVNEYAVWGDSA